jgi:acyl-CoA synthetase (AMP-forming)/AMP-acid ligase II
VSGERIGTLAWNDHRHLELYFATSCAGFVCHTINPRLFPAQIEYIVRARRADRWLFVDPAVRAAAGRAAAPTRLRRRAS